MNTYKIAIIGAGAVGTQTAYALTLANTPAEIMLVDSNEKRCHGEILDLHDAQAFCQYSTLCTGTVIQAGQSDIIIIAAGARQIPGQSRRDLLQSNSTLIESLITRMQPLNPSAIIIMVTNPLDPLTRLAQEKAKIDRSQIFGTGTFIDSHRLRSLIAQELSIAPSSIHAYMLGEHGDTQFAAWSSGHIGGVPLTQLLSQERRQAIEQKVKNRAYEIIECKGSTYFGIGTCVAVLCASIMNDTLHVAPLSVYVKEFDVCMSIPVVIGRKGIKEQLPMNLDHEEREKLKASAQALKLLEQSIM